MYKKFIILAITHAKFQSTRAKTIKLYLHKHCGLEHCVYTKVDLDNKSKANLFQGSEEFVNYSSKI